MMITDEDKTNIEYYLNQYLIVSEKEYGRHIQDIDEMYKRQNDRKAVDKLLEKVREM